MVGCFAHSVQADTGPVRRHTDLSKIQKGLVMPQSTDLYWVPGPIGTRSATRRSRSEICEALGIATNSWGVYRITNVGTGKLYIGSSGELAIRIAWHHYRLFLGRHPNKSLQKDWNNSGHTTFRFSVIEVLDSEPDLFGVPQLQEIVKTREQYWMKVYDSKNTARGYNKQPPRHHLALN
jgi:hypothetical protein